MRSSLSLSLSLSLTLSLSDRGTCKNSVMNATSEMLSAALRATVMDNYVPNEGRRRREGGQRGKSHSAHPAARNARNRIYQWTDDATAAKHYFCQSRAGPRPRLMSATDPNLWFSHLFCAHGNAVISTRLSMSDDRTENLPTSSKWQRFQSRSLF